MEWLTNYINIYYMLTFMAVCWFVFNKTKLLKKIALGTAWLTLIIGAIIGVIYFFAMEGCTLPILITTFTIGTSFYELIIKNVLKALGQE